MFMMATVFCRKMVVVRSIQAYSSQHTATAANAKCLTRHTYTQFTSQPANSHPNHTTAACSILKLIVDVVAAAAA